MNVLLAISPGILAQLQLFFWTFLMSVIMWFCYDLLRLWRRLLPRGTLWISVEDLVFFFICAIVGFVILYPQSRGQMKGFMILAFGIGTLAYQMLLGRFLIRAGGRRIHRIRSRFRQRFKKKEKIKENTENPIEK